MGPHPDSMAGGVMDVPQGLPETGDGETARLEERFRAIFDQAAVGIVQITLDGRFLEVNPGFCRMVGYTPAELLGRSVYTISHPDDHATMSEQIRQLYAGEVPSAHQEKRYIHK